MPYAALIAAGVSIVSKLLEMGEKARAAEVLENLKTRVASTDLPRFEREIAEQLGPSAMEALRPDAGLVDAQRQVYEKLRQIDDAGGYTLEDQATLARIGNANARHEAAGRNAIANNMAARGVGGSGAELAAQLSNNQAAAARANEAGLDLAGRAQRRAFEAIARRGDLAGRMRDQDWQERSQTARAHDYIKQWNADSRRRANEYNNAQSQQQYANQMQRLGMEQGIAGPQANYMRQDADANQRWLTTMAVGGAKAASDYSSDDDEDYASDDSGDWY